MIRYAPAATPPLPSPAPCRKSVIRKLAETYRELDGAGVPASSEVLSPLGFSDAIVRRIGRPAAALARRLSVREASR